MIYYEYTRSHVLWSTLACVSKKPLTCVSNETFAYAGALLLFFSLRPKANFESLNFSKRKINTFEIKLPKKNDGFSPKIKR